MISDTQWLSLLCESTQRQNIVFEGYPLPGFPPEELQLNTVGKSGVQAVNEAFAFYSRCKEYFEVMEQPLQRGMSLLDFGTGWGRIARCFIRDLGRHEIFGVDVTEEFVEICQKSFRSNNFIVNSPYPPTPIPDERFNFIVAYSVFSHLSEEASAAWVREFWRVLAPGGIVAVTTRSREFFSVCEGLKGLPLVGYSKALSELFDDFDHARRRYDSGMFVHSNIPGVGGGGRMNSSFYGESFIPEAYARQAYLPHFELKYFVPGDAYLEQSLLFFQKIT